MQPQIAMNLHAVCLAVAGSFLFGLIWHTVLFGKLWARLMKMPVDHKPSNSAMTQSMLIGIVGTFLMAFVMQHTLDIWRPSVWGVGMDQPYYYYGFMNGFFVWLGFFLPMQLSAVAWEGRCWKLFALNNAYHFLNLQLISMILAYWH